LKQTITHPLPVCLVHCSLTSDTERTFVALQFAHPMTQKSINLVKEREKYLKMFGDGQFYPRTQNFGNILYFYIQNLEDKKSMI
jgi:hypothetical protein